MVVEFRLPEEFQRPPGPQKFQKKYRDVERKQESPGTAEKFDVARSTLHLAPQKPLRLNFAKFCKLHYQIPSPALLSLVRWPSGLRRQLKVFWMSLDVQELNRWSERAWVRIPLSSSFFGRSRRCVVVLCAPYSSPANCASIPRILMIFGALTIFLWPNARPRYQGAVWPNTYASSSRELIFVVAKLSGEFV